MFGRHLSWIAYPAALLTATAALAKDPTPATDAQVEKLQKQLDQMSKELAELKKAVKGSNLSGPQREMMMGHMGKMEGQMHGMMSDMHGMECKMESGKGTGSGMMGSGRMGSDQKSASPSVDPDHAKHHPEATD
jgi:hypothetical protein